MRWWSVKSGGGGGSRSGRVMLPCGGGGRSRMRRRWRSMVRMKWWRRWVRMRVESRVERRVRVMWGWRGRQQGERLLMISDLLFRHFVLAAPRHRGWLGCLFVQDQGRSSCMTPRARSPSIHDCIVRRSWTDFSALRLRFVSFLVQLLGLIIIESQADVCC